MGSETVTGSSNNGESSKCEQEDVVLIEENTELQDVKSSKSEQSDDVLTEENTELHDVNDESLKCEQNDDVAFEQSTEFQDVNGESLNCEQNDDVTFEESTEFQDVNGESSKCKQNDDVTFEESTEFQDVNGESAKCEQKDDVTIIEENTELQDVNGGPVEDEQIETSSCYYLAKFKLYETRSYFYMVGRDKSKRYWRVLKIDRLESSDLVLCEDPTVYSYSECCALLRRIHEGNKHTGGLKFVTTCYGIVGFVRFLGPYYMILITERRKVGMLCGHAIYAVAKSKMIPIPHSTVRSNVGNSKNENRYKKLLSAVDITKDFYFSYSYRITHSLQKNLRDHDSKLVPYETMFVWNAFLTRGVRSHLGNTLWTVALIHGFFKQIKFTNCGRTVNVTLIARRSRHYAGTRYLKRGVNEKGRAANDVETEQIVFEDIAGKSVSEISSVVQIRGSIPLLWSQETSRLSIKPDIMLRQDPNYEATQRHFENLVDRYGNPIFILNLIKTKEKKPRESVLHAEFVKAVATINKGLDIQNRLKFRTVDLTRLFRLKGAKVLTLLSKVAGHALDQTGFFYCPLPPYVDSEMSLSLSHATMALEDVNEYSHSKVPRFQSGVLRTNCIDCLDRTNVAQYAYGLVALGHQLHAIGIYSNPKIDLDDNFAYKLMGLYEDMGDTLAFQYGGSAAHNKIFSERKGHWKAATQSQEFIRTLQRYLSNAYMDPEKQDAINLFLGHFQPEEGKPTLWELDSDQHYNIGRLAPSLSDEISRLSLKRSLSDGVLVYESNSPAIPTAVRENSNFHQTLPDLKEDKTGLSESTPEISTCDTTVSSSRYTPSLSARQLFSDTPDIQYVKGVCSCYDQHGDEFDCADIFDLDWISSSGNSCEEETYDRSSLLNSPVSGSLYGSIVNENTVEGKTQPASPLPANFPDSFVNWVEYGATFA
ncbi:phosphoinositide phosphatase SAC2-like [Silene latifolia]|uniref:phosphoinositide phosphatase SAC2-like n=1 Tax=Silene latifolia TaxID=37657 RepID=UPI003D789C0F